MREIFSNLMQMLEIKTGFFSQKVTEFMNQFGNLFPTLFLKKFFFHHIWSFDAKYLIRSKTTKISAQVTS